MQCERVWVCVVSRTIFIFLGLLRLGGFVYKMRISRFAFSLLTVPPHSPALLPLLLALSESG